MNEAEFQEWLQEAIEDFTSPLDDSPRVKSFSSAGVLTRNAGLVVRFSDGTEFQVTIVQSA